MALQWSFYRIRWYLVACTVVWMWILNIMRKINNKIGAAWIKVKSCPSAGVWLIRGDQPTFSFQFHNHSKTICMSINLVWYFVWDVSKGWKFILDKLKLNFLHPRLSYYSYKEGINEYWMSLKMIKAIKIALSKSLLSLKPSIQLKFLWTYKAVF